MVSRVMQQIFFGRGFERPLHVEQARLDHHHGDGNAALVADDELDIGPVFDLGAAAARAAEERQLHCAGVDGVERGGQIGDKLVGAGEADLRVAHAECRHALKQEHGVGHGDFEVRLLQTVAQAGVEQLDL